AYTNLGFLEYSFIETVEAMHPFYVIRAIGGLLFLVGVVRLGGNAASSGISSGKEDVLCGAARV
ncbi:MAG: cytochrome C oxidase, partial [Pseudolabrys sp.]